ncbi:pumilio homology domain family member 4 [Ceratobasidium sp. AG-Ba]|nr:pumilio homology domain family member 4 [Ceratobasidium sp. AG-Ba]QRW07629.1 pumilio homology domain family member 4 [Ceratobasidium sp. AG-Ba]
MCADEEAQLVLFTIFDVVDDTKLVGKSLVTDITALAPKFARTLARRVLLYLLTPRSPRHFTPALLRNIAQTDFAQGTTSKKDVDIRRSELRGVASPGMIKAVEDDAEGLVRDRGGSMFVGEVMLFADGVTLIQGGHFNQQTKQIERVEGAPKNVTTAFMGAAGKDNLIAMAMGDEGFLVAEIVGRLKEEGNEAGLKEVKGWFGKDVRTKLKTEGKKGSAVLLERLGA